MHLRPHAVIHSEYEVFDQNLTLGVRVGRLGSRKWLPV